MALVASTASFHQKLTEPDVSINPGTQITYPGLPMLDGSSKSTFPVVFGTFCFRLWRPFCGTRIRFKGKKVKCTLPINIQIPFILCILIQRSCKCYLHYHVLGSMTLKVYDKINIYYAFIKKNS